MKLTKIKSFFFITLTVLLFSCNKNIDKDTVKNTITDDSISNWLDKSKNNLKKENKKSFDKAYAYLLLKRENDSLTRSYLNDISYWYILNNYYPEFIESNTYRIKMATMSNDSTSLAGAYWDMAYYYRKKNKIDSSFYNYAKAQNIYKNLKDEKKEGKMWANIANIQKKVKDYKASEISSINALQLLKDIEDTERDVFDSYNNLGSVNNSMKKHDNALKYYMEALVYQKKIKNKNTLNLYVLNNIGNVYSEKGEYSKAKKYYKQVLETDSLYHNNTRLYTRVLSSLAYYRFKKGDTNNVEKQMQRSLKISDSIQYITGIAISNYNLAEYYLVQKDTAKALGYAKKSKEYAKKNKNNKRLLQAYNLLTSLEPKKGGYYANKYIQLNDSLLQAERNLQDKFALIEFETDAVKEALEKETQLLDSVVIGGFLVLLAMFIIGGQYFKNQKLKFEKVQQENNLEIFNLMLSQKEQLALVKQEEQHRISQELHDGVVAALTGIGMILKITNKRADEEAINERSIVIEKLQETAEEIRGISHELNAASEKRVQNFTYSLQELLDNTEKASGILTKFSYNKNIDWDTLEASVKINLYRIAQEAIQNCVKHAKAKNINLDLNGDESNFYVILSDNGVGFNPKKNKKGIGQKNIFSRVKKIKAKINIDSQMGKGTKIKITIPVKKRA